MKYTKKILKFFTASKRRKILSGILVFLILLTSVRFLFFRPKIIKASTMHWPFSEGYGTSVGDNAGNSLTGTITNAVWRQEDLCRTNKCLYFDGSGDYVSITDAASGGNLDFVAADDFTIMGWFRHPTISTNPDYILAKHESGTAGGYKIWMDSDGDIAFGIDDDGTWGPEDVVGDDQTRNYDDNRWHHFAAVKDGTTGIYIYVDGDLIDSDISLTASGTLANAATFYIGIDADGSSNSWEGFIDEIKVHREVRTASEIKADTASGAPEEGASASFSGIDQSFLSNGLVGYWKLDETSGNATDSSGNSLTLTNNGTTTYVNGKYGRGSEHVPASTQYLSTATTINGVQSVSFWTNPDSATNYYVSLTSGAYITSSSGTLSATGFTNPKIFVNGVETTTIAADTWQFVTVSTETAINANQFYVGRQDTNYYDGTLDEVRLYNRVLTPDISALYNWGPGPVAYWKMDENTGTTTNDSSGNGNNSQTFSGEVAWTIGEYGSALTFDGTNDVVQISETTSTDLGSGTSSESMTVAAWIKSTTDFSGNATIVAKDDGSGAYPFHLYVNSSEQPCFAIYDGTNNPSICDNGTTINSGQWTYLAGRRDVSTDTLTIWTVRIQNSTADTTTAALTNNDDVSIGNSGTSYTANDFTGSIDDVKIYNYARSENQLREDREAGHSAGSYVSIHSYWKIDEGGPSGEGNGIIDSVGTRPGSMSASRWTPNGKFNSAFDGDGTNYISVADFASMAFDQRQSFSWAIWFKSDTSSNPSTTEYILNKNLSGGTQEPGYAMYVNSSDQICFAIDDDSTWTPDVSVCTTQDYYDTTWHHLVGIRNVSDDKLYIYVDGVLKNSTADTTTDTLFNNRTTFMGDRDGTNNGDELNGDLDEIMLFVHPLTAGQVRTLYNNNSEASLGVLSTDDSGNPSNAQDDSYCPPGTTRTNCVPVAHYAFSENDGQRVRNKAHGTFTDASDGVFAASGVDESEDPSWASGPDGRSAVEFDSTEDDHIRVADPSDGQLDIADGVDFTLTAWFYRDTSGTADVIVDKKGATNATNNRPGYSLYITSSNDINFDVAENNANGDTRIKIDSVSTFTTPGWNHVIAIFDEDSATGSTIYINGVEDKENAAVSPSGTITDIGTTDTTQSLGIGRRVAANFDSFDGKIFDVRLYKYALTPEEAAWTYNRGGPIGWWKFDENTGSVANDASGKGNSGSITEAAYVSGKRNYALDFDGSNDFVDMNDVALYDFNDKNFSIAGWFNRDTFTTDDTIISKKNTQDNTTAGFNVWIDDSSDDINFVVSDGDSANIHTVDSTTAFTSTGWNHFVIVYDDTSSSGSKIYINGKDNSATNTTSGTFTSINDLSNAVDFRIGSEADGGEPFDGKLDDIQIFNYRLTAQQAITLYNSGVASFLPAEGAP